MGSRRRAGGVAWCSNAIRLICSSPPASTAQHRTAPAFAPALHSPRLYGQRKPSDRPASQPTSLLVAQQCAFWVHFVVGRTLSAGDFLRMTELRWREIF